LENVGIFFFSAVKTFHESPHPIAGNWSKARRVQKMLGCFFFLVVKKRFILETGGKPKEVFLLKIGGKLREKECWDVFFFFAVKRNLCWKLEESSERECWDVFCIEEKFKAQN
jgi:hypothetical protein